MAKHPEKNNARIGGDPCDAVPTMSMRAYFQNQWHPGTAEGYDCALMRRMGAAGDGGKMVCLDALPAADRPCFVLSVGVGGDFSFEIDLHQRAPHCQIDAMDGTNYGHGAIRNAPSFVNFVPLNFDAVTWRKYKDRRVDILKIDCEVLRAAQAARASAPRRDTPTYTRARSNAMLRDRLR